MGMIDPKKIPPTPEQVRALEEAKKCGSITNPAGFKAMIEALQAKLPGPQREVQAYQIRKATLEERVAALEAAVEVLRAGFAGRSESGNEPL